MKGNKLFLFFLIIATLLFAACAKTPVEKVAEPPQKTEEARLSINLATGELLSTYDSLAEFIEFDDEGYQRILITSNVAVKDFKFIEVGFEERDSSIVFLENEVLYSLEELTPQEPFLVTWMEWGSIPHRGISFTDETGKTRYFYIGMSGEDGSLFLTEFM